jgi:hypothetical protein
LFEDEQPLPSSSNYEDAPEDEDDFEALREMLMSTKNEIDKVVGGDLALGS